MSKITRFKPLALAAAVLVSLGATSPVQADETILIGLAGPLTGPSARIGKDLENGAQLAIADANAQKPTLQGKPVTFKLLSEDDQSDPRTAVAVAQRLVDEGVAGVVGHWNTGTSIPAARIYHDAGIAQVAPVATGHGYTQQGFDTSFRVMGHDDDGGHYAGDYAVKVLKAKRIAVIDDRTAFGQGLADEFIKSLAAQGLQPVAREYVDDKTVDFSALKTGLKGSAFPLVMDLSIDGQDSYMNLLFQNGNHIVPKDGQPTDIANDKSIWVYQQLQAMMKDGLMPSAQQMSEVKTENIFQSNRAAMVYAGSWLAAPFANNPLINDHIGVVMMPKIERQSGVAHSLAFAMSANSAHKQEAWKYIEFMSTEASQTELAKAVIPANKLAAKAWAAEIKKVDVTPYIDTLNVTEAYPTAGTNTPKWQNMWIASLKKIFMGADAKAEMDKSVKKIERVMEQ
jgi:hypothetical protein